MALGRQASDYAIDDGFAVEDHAKPTEGGNGADALLFDWGHATDACSVPGWVGLYITDWNAFVGPSSWINHAEVSIASENECLTRPCCLPHALRKNHGRKARIGEDVEVFANGIKGY